MAVINDKYRFMFLCEPHTASRSVRDALMTLETSRETSTYHHCDVPRAIHNNYLTRQQALDYFYFSTIRNPHDWLVTQWYISCSRIGDGLLPWMRKHYKKNQRNGTLFWRFLDNVNVFMRYEKLQEGLNQVLAKRGAPPLELETKIKSDYKTPGKTTWEREWSESMYEWAALHYPDIDQYGYQQGFDLAAMEPLATPITV
jgi:hypothetical protein